MRRGVFDALRRGLDNTLANWPLIAIRVAEGILFGILAVATVMIVVLPIILSIGIRIADFDDPDDIAGALELLTGKWVLLLWVIVAATLLLILFLAIHSFVMAGSARVYVDAERIAGPETVGPRSRFRIFSVSRWSTGAVSGWWSVFWIYNAIWAVAGLVLLVPLVPTLILVLVFRENPPLAAATGCIGLIATVLLVVVVGVFASIWSARAIVAWATHRAGAADAVAAGWRTMRTDFLRSLGIALSLIIVGMAGALFFASFSFLGGLASSMGDTAMVALITLPIRLIATLLSSVYSAGVNGWYLASFAAVDEKAPPRAAAPH